jgi:hypothetical protein
MPRFSLFAKVLLLAFLNLSLLLLAVAIYYVLIFLRGTRAAPVLIGFLILLLVLFALAAADVVQGCVDYTVDNGSGGAPIVSHFYSRPRIYYDDATNEYVGIGNVAQLASTDYPALAAAESGRLLGPRIAVKSAKASANMTSSTAMRWTARAYSRPAKRSGRCPDSALGTRKALDCGPTSASAGSTRPARPR